MSQIKQRPIRRKRELCPGIYIKGEVENIPITFTADTGASATVLATKVYNRLAEDRRPVLKSSACLSGAGGCPLNELGKAEFNFKLDTLELRGEMVVADIEDECLVGVDILQNSQKGPADIILSKGLIILDKHKIRCSQIGLPDSVRKVSVAGEFTIPGLSEAVIDVFVKRTESDDDDDNASYIIEPTEHFTETYPLQMAATLVNLNTTTTQKVRLLNPFSSQVTIRQDTVIGKAEKIDDTTKLITIMERDTGSDNNNCVRKIQLNKGDTDILRKVDVSKSAEITVPEHLKQLFEVASKDRTPNEAAALARLLKKHENTFSKDEWDIGLTNLTEHSINTGDAVPIKQPPRRVPLAYATEEKRAIDDLLAKGVIRKSTSPWASPIVLVKKKSGAVRPCVDYRRLNELVKPDGFPMPRIQDCLDSVSGACLFSTFDLTSGYFQIPLREEDIPKSAFACKYGHYEMTRMPFGLNNSASTFQRTIELALQGLQWEICLIYIDDIIVFGSSFEEHISRVEQVLERIKAAGLKLKPEKCEMLQREVVFLGHVVSGEGVRPNPANIAKVMAWPAPKTVKQVKSFVALGSYFRRFIRNYAQIARPMVDLTKKGRKFFWSEACERSFNEIKAALISPEVMGYPKNEGGEFILDVDGCDTGIGAVLLQIQDGRERVIAYASRALNKAEANYCITEKELLAVRYFIEYFRQYLLGRRFKVRSDHQALVWLFKLREPRGKIARWIEILSQYDFSIEYRPGTKQGHCDALSRCENPKDCDCPFVDTCELLKCGPCKKCLRRAESMELMWKRKSEPMSGGCPDDENGKDASKRNEQTHQSPEGLHCSVKAVEIIDEQIPSTSCSINNRSPAEIEQMRIEQLQDVDIAMLLQAKEENIKPSSKDMVDKSATSRHYWIYWDILFVHNGVLMKSFKKKNGTGDFDQIIVPKQMRKDILYQMHNSLLSGHMGIKKTKEKILQRFYWFNLKEDVKMYIKQCDICAKNKRPVKTPKAPMGSLKTGEPWDILATDYIGPLPITPRGNRYILVLTDHFTKFVEVIAVPDQSAEVCASKILNEFIARWGCPLSIHSDQGRNYESKVFKELCRMLEIKKTRTSAKNPRCNGVCEKINATIIKMIKAYLCREQEEWDLNLGCIAGAYRATPNETTKLSPNLLTMGRETRLPAELIYGSLTTKGANVTSYGEYVDNMRAKMQYAHEVARKHIGKSANRSKEIYDVKLMVNSYSEGDAVWCLLENRKVGVSHKLEPVYDGPFMVKRKLSDIDFVLQMDKQGKEKVVHHNKLKPYEGSNTPRWIGKARNNINLKN